MKIILKKDVDNVGEAHEVVEVADGYAKNYLIPQGMAVKATKGNLHDLRQRIESSERQRQRRLDEAQETAETIDGYTLIIPRRAGDEGRLFGSVTNRDIAQGLNEELDVDVHARQIRLEEPIRSLGTYQISIGLYRDVEAHLQVEVLAEQD